MHELTLRANGSDHLAGAEVRRAVYACLALALSGNLCRCGAYRNIVPAAQLVRRRCAP